MTRQAREPFMQSTSFQFRDYVDISINVKFLLVESEETMRLVSPVILGAKTPVNVRKDRLLFKVYCAEHATAYF